MSFCVSKKNITPIETKAILAPGLRNNIFYAKLTAGIFIEKNGVIEINRGFKVRIRLLSYLHNREKTKIPKVNTLGIFD